MRHTKWIWDGHDASRDEQGSWMAFAKLISLDNAPNESTMKTTETGEFEKKQSELLSEGWRIDQHLTELAPKRVVCWIKDE